MSISSGMYGSAGRRVDVDIGRDLVMKVSQRCVSSAISFEELPLATYTVCVTGLIVLII